MEAIGCEVCAGAQDVVGHIGLGRVDDAQAFPLGKRRFFQFIFSLIRFLAVRRAGQLVMDMYRIGGPLP